jgi:hypothetical protein
VALGLAGSLCGCGRPSVPLARVADHTLTVADFEREGRGVNASIPGTPEEAKAMLLRELVQRELVELAAHAHGLDTLAATRRSLRQMEDRMLMQALYRELAPADVGVSEGEARAFYARRNQKADVHLVYTTDPTIIKMANAQLAAGVPFEEVANRFNAPNTMPPGGAIGPHAPGDLFQPLDDAIEHQPVGVVGGPWETPRGWFLMKLTSRQRVAQEPFETQQSALMEQIRRRKLQQAISSALLGLEREHGMTVIEPGQSELFRYLAPGRASNAPRWTPNAAERTHVLATWDNGSYVLGDAIEDLENVETRGPDASSLIAVRAWVQGRAVERIALAEARRRHLDEEPEFRHQLDEARFNDIGQAEVSLALLSTPGLDEASVHAEWDKIKRMYPQVKSAHVRWVASPDTAVTAAIARRAAPGVDFAAAVHSIDPKLEIHDEVLKLPTQAPEWGELESMAGQMPRGAWTAPIFTGRDWRVVQLLDKDAAPLEWDQLNPAQKQQFSHNIGDRRRQERYATYLDSLWSAKRPVLMLENLKRVPWPLPGVEDAAP